MGTLVIPDEAALSAKEHAQWMLHRLAPGRGICNIGVAIRVEKHLRWWPLQQALDHLMRRHPALRAVLDLTGPFPRKRFLGTENSVPVMTEAATEESLPALLGDLVARPFALSGEPLIRAQLVLMSGASVVCLVFHHLVVDHQSIRVLLEEFASLYDGLAEQGEVPATLSGGAPAYQEPPPDPAAVEYWVRQLAGVDPSTMALAAARPITTRPTFAGDRLGRWMPEQAVAAVGQIQRRTRLTRNMILLGGFSLLLARHGAGPDLVVGIPINARPAEHLDVVGYHFNTLPIRVAVDEASSVADLLELTSRALLAGMEHGGASFETIQAALPQRSDDWRVPLFRHMFNYLPSAAGTLRIAGEQPMVFEVPNGTSRLDLEMKVFERPTGIETVTVYSTEVHDRQLVQTLLERYDAILVGLATALERPLRAVSAHTGADQAALRRLNATRCPSPDQTLLEDVREWAITAPAAPAVRAAGGEVSYAGLIAAAEAVRQALVARGVRPGDTVALCSARRPELAAAVLGVWAAGAAYLPLDPAHPARRIAEQLDDAGARLVLADGETDRAGLTGLPWLGLAAACRLDATGGTPDLTDRWLTPDPAAAAYVIYTSGSTGRPKGVEVSHASLANLVHDFVSRLSTRPDDRTLWLTTFSFDISALELLLPLASGGTVVVAPDEDRLEPSQLLARIVAEEVTILQATPTTLRQLTGQLAGQLRGRRVLSGGEPLSRPLAERLLASGCRLYNVYGPTETTVWSTVADLAAPVEDPVPVGAPIANTTVHVLDRHGQPVLPGMPGELCIAGIGVAIGYRGQPELTADRFREDPAMGRYYRTGDRVRLGTSGLVFLGRGDRQVKIRGHRIELTEVEAVLEAHPSVRAAAAITEPDGAGHLRLVAAVQPDLGDQPAADGLREFAAQRLPSAAVPSRYVAVPELPMTGNGKVDHRALGARLARSGGPVQLPADPLLRTLTTLWREVLADDRLDVDANFFLSGGHSLLAVELAGRLSEVLGADVGFDAVFGAPSPARFATWLAEHGVSREAPGEPR